MTIANDTKKLRFEATQGVDDSLYIIGGGSQLLAFFNQESMAPYNANDFTESERQVSQHRRKRYPGDPGAIVRQHDRTVGRERSSGGGGAMPGERFWCERPSGEGDARRSNARQFAYEGTWRSLKRFARAAGHGSPFILRNSSGKSIIVTPD